MSLLQAEHPKGLLALHALWLFLLCLRVLGRVTVAWKPKGSLLARALMMDLARWLLNADCTADFLLGFFLSCLPFVDVLVKHPGSLIDSATVTSEEVT